MPKPLVIVESPAKARTIAGFLGRDFVVESSIGHIRDLPRRAADVPAAYKNEPWARLGVDVDNGFKPLYVLSSEKRQQVAKLRSRLKDGSEPYLATDEDREGESIAWHLLEVLGPQVPVKRMVFHEITQQAIRQAVDDWRELDRRLVDAQEARRILDRLYGYEVSPVLWKKVMPRLSAGRVQSVATRIVVERERERMRFRAASYWDVEGVMEKPGSEPTVNATLVAPDGARRLYGDEYVPDRERQYEKKVRNAQEAHEAIRPAGDAFRTPEQLRRELHGDELALYELVWQRTVASQMADAAGRSAQVRLGATSPAGEDVEFAASGKVITFPGFLRAYVEGSDDPDAELEDREVRLPALGVGDRVRALSLEERAHETQPPPRYTEASLVKALEELGVGRPSTYASIMETIQDRGYVWKKGAALVPSFTAFSVVSLLEQHFADLVDYAFTARMEDDLDEIATGEEEAVPWLTRFYFGNGQPGLKTIVASRLGEIDAREVNSITIGADNGTPIVVRVGRYGPYLQRGDDTAGIPDDLPPDDLTVERAVELLEAPSGDRELGTDPETGLPVFARAGRYGHYVQLGEAEAGSRKKPKTASILKTMALDTVTLDEALRLLSLPRVVGVDPADGEEITVQNGRYGPYVKKGKESRSIESEDQLFTLTLDEALAALAQPRRRRGQATAAPVRELGPDPATGRDMVVKEGRYGPYVTDGETNASVPKDESVEALTPERGADLLATRRAKGPSRQTRKKASGRAKKAAKRPRKTA